MNTIITKNVFAPHVCKCKGYRVHNVDESADLTSSACQSPLALLISHISYLISHILIITYSHILYLIPGGGV